MADPKRALPSIGQTIQLPVLRGVQAGREYFVAMCHLGFIAKNLPFPPENLPPEKVIQRHINKARIPRIADYLVKYHDDYVLPPIIASIDGDTEFEPLGFVSESMQVGILKIAEPADLVINDGQHRCAAIKQALERKPELRLETLAVVFYVDRGIRRARQIFSDLNGHPVRTNKNITTTFDSRPYLPGVTRQTIDRSPLLRERVEMFASSCAAGSPRMFTISALDKAHGHLLRDLFTQDAARDVETCVRFWAVLERCLPDVKGLIEGRISAQEIKETYFYPYSIALQALAGTANHLMKAKPRTWEKELVQVGHINWRRNNTEWEGRAMNGGRLTTGGNHPILTRNYIKKRLQLKLTPEEERVEENLTNAQTAGAGQLS